jgi:[ribosomal protein S18]-alanine N-acetyltransferase
MMGHTPPIVIRPLEARDEAPCARLMSASEPWLTLGRDFEASLAVVRDRSAEVYVAEDDGRFAGFIILSLVGVLNGYIRTIAVEPSRRGRGVGSHLMDFAESKIFASSPNAFLCVTSFNDGARRLYERLGYHYVGELSDFFVPGVSELLYRKTRGSWAEFRDETTTNPVGTSQ